MDLDALQHIQRHLDARGAAAPELAVEVGETVDRSTGEIKGVVGNGEVRVERRGAQAR